MKKRLWIFFLILFVSFNLFSTKTIKVKYDSWKDFLKGEFKGVMLNENGSLNLSYKIKSIVKPPENLVFSATTDNSGNIFIGTGHSGKLYKISGSAIKTVYTAKEPDIFAITSDKNGNIYFATSPNGRVYKLSKSGKIKEFFDSKDRFYWQLSVKNSSLYIAAGGMGGKLYKVNLADGHLETTYKIDELNVFKFFIKDNTIYLGGSEKGTVYEIKKGLKQSIFQSDRKEIKGIYVNSKDEIFIATGGESLAKTSKFYKKIVIRKTNTAGEVFKIDKDGEVIKIWKSNNEMPYDLKGNDGKVLWVTGDKGRIYSYENNKVSLIGEVEGKIGVSLYRLKNKFLGLYDFPAGVFEIEDTKVLKGTYLSEIYDAGALSSFGNFFVKSIGNVGISYRAGNTSKYDNSWTGWSPIQKIFPFNINIRKKRYFQFKVEMVKEQKEPELSYLKFYYLPVNRAPVIEKINISKKKKDRICIKIASKDMDKDFITYSLYLKKGSKWILVEKDLIKSPYCFDKRNFEEGEYDLKVVASDHKSNPKNYAKSSSKIVKNIVIDYTPPSIQIDKDVKGRVSFTASDKISNIAKAYYHTGDRKWKILFPDDKIFDSKRERFTIFEKMAKIIVVRVEDEEGNIRVRIIK